MADLPTASDISSLAALLAPGIVIMWVRGRFRDSTPPKISDQLVGYAIISVVYNALVYPLFHVGTGLQLASWIWHLLHDFISPIVIAFAIAFVDSSEGFYNLTERIDLRAAHHISTAWEYTFRNRAPSYVIVHLIDGSNVAGTWSGSSFASTMAGDRDILIADMWRISADGVEWTRFDPPRSILICGGSVRMVEFITGGV